MNAKKITGTGKQRQRNDVLGVLAFERALTDAAAKCFQLWLPQAEGAVFGSLTASMSPDPSGVFAVTKAWREVLELHFLPTVEKLMIERMVEHMEATGVVGLLPPVPADAGAVAGVARTAIYDAAAAGVAGVAYSAPGVRDFQQHYLREVSNRLVRVPDKVFDIVRGEVDLSMSLGESNQVRAKRIRDLLSYTESEQWPKRAITIARTESTGAYNSATLQAAKVRSLEYAEPLRKVWLCGIDDRTRDAHFAADGQIVDMDAKFNVGGEELEYPGDPSGSPGNIINCRCGILELGPGDELPSELDRHTERGERDATVRNRKGSRQDEIDRRADRGVTRARDEETPTDAILAAGQHKEKVMTQHWKGILAPMGKLTGDNRKFADGAEVNFREFPLPLMWQRQTKDGHMDAYTVGSIRSAHIEMGNIVAEGVFFDTPEAGEALKQVEDGVTRPSVDLCNDSWELVDQNGNLLTEEDIFSEENQNDPDFEVIFQFTAFTVMAATLVAKPAFGEAKIELTEVPDGAEASQEASLTKEEVGLVAAAAPGAPVYSTSLFQDPHLTGPTPLHMREDGRIVGHLALWRDCHMGVGDACVIAPRSNTGYSLFHIAEVATTEGQLSVGKLTVGGGHADPKLGVHPTVEHYDNAGSSFALVRAGEDDHGIWVSGVPASWASAEQVQLGLSCPLSGDWRRHGGNLELVAALSVNTPGFPVPRGQRDDQGRDYALVAAGAVPSSMRTEALDHGRLRQVIDQAVRESVESAMSSIAEKSTLEARASEMQAKVDRIKANREVVEKEAMQALAQRRAKIIGSRMGKVKS